MLIKSGQLELCNHNARTVRVVVPRNPQTGPALRILKPEQAIHELFMSTSNFYASHRDIAMTAQMVATLRMMKMHGYNLVQQRKQLSDAVEVIAASMPRSDARVRNALDEARLSLLAN